MFWRFVQLVVGVKSTVDVLCIQGTSNSGKTFSANQINALAREHGIQTTFMNADQFWYSRIVHFFFC